MTAVRITGSTFDRVGRCPASAALPQVIDDHDNEARDRGTALHKFLERVAAVGREVALAEVDELWRDLCADIELAKLEKQLTLSTEVAVAYNWRDDTARLLQPVEPRVYEIDDTCEVAATLDLLGAGDRVVYVGDYKGPYAWLPAPEDSYQLGAGAVAAARIFGARAAQVEYIRLRHDGQPRRFYARLDTFGLEAAADRLSTMMGKVTALRSAVAAGEVPDVTEGEWCKYCPARQHCPAKTALIRAVVSDPQPIPYSLPLSPEGARRAYELLKPVKAAIAQIEGALYAYAKLTPIPLGLDADGSERYFGELRRPGNEVLDGAVVHAVLAELYDGETANAAVTMEATKAAITNAVRKAMPPGEKITHHTTKVIETVRERGGATRPITTSTIEYTVDEEGGAKMRKRRAS